LMTVAGGKWTTYRKMAEDAVDQAIVLGGLDPQPCTTDELRIHGATDEDDESQPLAIYGSDAVGVQAVIDERVEYDELLHDAFDTRVGEIAWSVRNEMARTLEDVLSRRTRCLLLDARASVEAAPKAAAALADELGRDERWVKSQIEEYTKLAQGYMMA